MKKEMQKWLCGMSALAVCMMLTGCGHEHTWADATCTAPKTCTECGETEGEVLEHIWVEATCAEPKHCSVCGETEGEALEHTWTEATYQQPATCEVCGATEGEPLQAYFEKEGIECNAELDTEYPYVTPCYDSEYTTNGKVTFSDYEVFEGDETHEALEGHEWRAVTMTCVFDDDNAYNHGCGGMSWGIVDYYNEYFLDNYQEEGVSFSATYNGVEYTGIQRESEKLYADWGEDGVFRCQIREYMRVPVGYDGVVAYVCAPGYRREDDWKLADIKDEANTIIFRLK